MRRIGLMSKKVDMERLKKMRNAGQKKDEEVPSASMRRSTRGPVGKSKKQEAREKLVKDREEMLRRQSQQSRAEDGEDESGDGEIEEAVEDESEEEEDSEDDDDLFGADEIEMISSGKKLPIKTKKRPALSDDSDGSEDEVPRHKVG